MPRGGTERHHGDMSAATVSPAPAPHRASGATSVTGARRHRIGDALRAVRVFAGAAFDVIVLGEYGEEAGVRRR